MAPSLTRTAVASATAAPPFNFKTPSPTIKLPLKTFAPPSVSSAPPSFVKLCAPLMTPLMVPWLSTLSVVSEASATPPLKVKVPPSTASPKPRIPLITNSFPMARSAPCTPASVPPLNVTNPVPRAELFPSESTPALKSTPPSNVFTPVKAKTDQPFFTSIPDPLITPPYVVEPVPPRVNVFPSNHTAPSPASDAISSLLASLRVPPADTATAMLLMSALPPLSVSIPASTFVGPPKVFTPLNVSPAAPAFVKL